MRYIRASDAVEAILNRYKAGERDFSGIELPEGSPANFRGVTLTGAIFRSAWLSGADFLEANLQDACFDEANVKSCDFRWSDLRSASFRRAALCGAHFYGAKIDDVVVDQAEWYGAQVKSLRDLI